MSLDVPRIVKPPIIMQPSHSFEALMETLYEQGWKVNSNLKGNTMEEAVELQAKTFPCIEFQPVHLPPHPYMDGKWIAFHRTTVEEWLNQEQKPQTIPLEDPKPQQPLRRQHKNMLDCNSPDPHSCDGCSHYVNSQCQDTPKKPKLLSPIATTQEEEEANLWDEETTEDPEPIKVQFREMFKPHPTFNVGDILETTHGVSGKVLEVKAGEPDHLAGNIYILDVNGEKQWFHESAIKGKAVQQQSLTGFFGNTQNPQHAKPTAITMRKPK